MKYRYDTFNHNEFESHQLVYGMIDDGSKVLDIGCATGYFAKELLKKNCEAWGVDFDEKAVTKANKYCFKTAVCNFDEMKTLPWPKDYFDFILILDVIEHLSHPERIISAIKPHLKKGGRVIVSVPNVAHAQIRYQLCLGKFEYTSTGIMDKTHVHFYTRKSFLDTLKQLGLETKKLIPTNGMCKVPLLYKITDRLPAWLQYRITCWIPTLFANQFIALSRFR